MGHKSRHQTPELLSTKRPSPFLKWAGGKGQLLRQLDPLLPREFDCYVEPFVGGGAMFFHLHNLGRIEDGAILNDLNAELMNCYRVVQDKEDLRGLISLLNRHAQHVMDEDYYYRVRAWDREAGFAAKRSPVERAARTIFLNHACYNGLYRLNSKGEFNVPYGKWLKPPSLFDEHNLWACHHALQGVDLREERFAACRDWVTEGDFVYLDPPYVPLSPTSSFTSYSGVRFLEDDQRCVSAIFRDLVAKGAKVLLTNSDTSLVRELYRGSAVEELSARRSINSRGAGRGAIKELAIFSYVPPSSPAASS